MAKEIEIIIDDDGKIIVDQVGYKGNSCSGDIKDILNAMGKKEKVKKKIEFNSGQNVNIRQN